MTRREQDAPYTHNNQNCQTPFKEKVSFSALLSQLYAHRQKPPITVELKVNQRLKSPVGGMHKLRVYCPARSKCPGRALVS